VCVCVCVWLIRCYLLLARRRSHLETRRGRVKELVAGILVLARQTKEGLLRIQTG